MIVFLATGIIDVIANVNHDYLNKYKLRPDGAIRATPGREAILNDITQFNPIVQPGGTALNSARLFQWVTRKQIPVVVAGCVGFDDYGDLIKRTLTEEGIHWHFCSPLGVTTRVVAVLITGQNRSMVTSLRASVKPDKMNLNEELWNHLHDADYFYFSAFSIRTCVHEVDKICSYFNDNLKTVIMNLGAGFLINEYRYWIPRLFKIASLIFGNAEEYRTLYQYEKNEDIPDSKLLDAIRHQYVAKPSYILVMTRGSEPLYVYTEGQLQQYDVPPIKAEEIVDTNAAGDAFVAGFLAQYVKGKDVAECVKCGLWTSREVIRQHGCNFDKNKVYES